MNKENIKDAKKKLCDMVRDSRLAAGISQDELSARTGISRATINRIENGRHWPRSQNLIAILFEFNKTISALEFTRKADLINHLKGKNKFG